MSVELPWPDFRDPALLDLWAQPDEGLFGRLPAFLALMAERTPEVLSATREAPYSYPFGPVQRTTWVDGDGVREVDAEEAAELRRGRVPLIAIGANGSADRLAMKLGGVRDRSALLTPADVEGVDICALPFPASYGSFPAGLAASPGTTVRTVVIDLTLEQLEWIALTEFGYRLVRLTDATARTEDGRNLRAPFGFVQRIGLYDIGAGSPAPLAAIPATDRRWPAWEQPDLYAHLARRLGDPTGDAEALRLAIGADFGGWAGAHAQPLLDVATTLHTPPGEGPPADAKPGPLS